MPLLLNIYKQVLKLLPPTYHEHYAEPMAQTLEDMLKDQPSPVTRAQIWLRATADLVITATYQYTEEGGITMNHMPAYAKRGTLISAALLLPFFLLVTANTLHPLVAYWKSIGYVGIFILPVVALVFGVGLLIKLLAAKELSLNLKQLQSNWVVFSVPLLALGIVIFAFGHDSVHCITAGNLHQIMECLGGE